MAKETINNGWICLHRAFRDWQHYGEPIVKSVFLDLLLTVNVKDGWWHGFKCERGATFRSIRTIADDTKLTPLTIRRALAKLEQTGEIKRIKINQKHTKTIVCNFSKYQDINYGSVLSNDTQSNTQSNTKQQYNNNNNIGLYKYNAHAYEEDIFTNIKKSAILIEQFCKTEGITADQFNGLVDEVQVDWALTNEKDQTKKHLLNAVRCKITNLREGGRLVRGTLAERKQRFLGECKALVDKGCDRESVAEFARYYTQLERGGERMLFETYKGWNTETRYLINQQLKQKKQ